MRTTAAGDASATASLRASDGIGALPSFPAKAKKVPKTNGFRNFCGKSNVHGYNAPCFDSVVHIFEDSVLMRRDNEDRRDTVALPVQEFSCSLLYHLFHQLQPIIGQIIPGVLPEAEGKQMAQTFFMGRGKHLFCRTDIVIVNAG